MSPQKFQSIFPLANLLAEGKMLGAGWHPPEPRLRISIFVGGGRPRHHIYPTRICVKLDDISSLLPQTGCLGKLCGPRYLGPKLAKSAIFSIFFSFSNITFEILILEEKF